MVSEFNNAVNTILASGPPNVVPKPILRNLQQSQDFPVMSVLRMSIPVMGRVSLDDESNRAPAATAGAMRA